MLRIWGITGQIGAGKSTVAKMLIPFGGNNLELDSIGHQMLQEAPMKNQLAEAFGLEIVGPDLLINRKRLGKLAFASIESMKKLNRIMHPPMIRAVEREIQLAREQEKMLLLINSALLYSMGLDKLCDLSIYVKAHPEIRLERIVTHRGLPIESARSRLLAQDPEPPPGPKAIICENNGNLDDLKTWMDKTLIPLLQVEG